MPNRYRFLLIYGLFGFTKYPDLFRPWSFETKRVGATGVPLSVCSGRWTIRLSWCCEAHTGSAVTERGNIFVSPPSVHLFLIFFVVA